MANTAKTVLNISHTFERDRDGSGTLVVREQRNTASDSSIEYSNGNASKKIEAIYSNIDTLSVASGTLDLDLTDLTDPAGQALVFTKIRSIYVRNFSAANGSDLLIGGAGTDAFTGPFKGSTTAQAGPISANGGEFFISNPEDGWTVSTNNKILRLDHDGGSSGDVTFEILIYGNTT